MAWLRSRRIGHKFCRMKTPHATCGCGVRQRVSRWARPQYTAGLTVTSGHSVVAAGVAGSRPPPERRRLPPPDRLRHHDLGSSSIGGRHTLKANVYREPLCAVLPGSLAQVSSFAQLLSRRPMPKIKQEAPGTVRRQTNSRLLVAHWPEVATRAVTRRSRGPRSDVWA